MREYLKIISANYVIVRTAKLNQSKYVLNVEHSALYKYHNTIDDTIQNEMKRFRWLTRTVNIQQRQSNQFVIQHAFTGLEMA